MAVAVVESSAGTLGGKFVEDFFTLTTQPYNAPNVTMDFGASIALSLPLLQGSWWDDLFAQIPLFGMPEVDIDIQLTLAFNLMYGLSFLLLILETFFEVMENVMATISLNQATSGGSDMAAGSRSVTI